MQKVLLLSFNLLIAVVIACQSVGQSRDHSMLRPGDEIEGMIISTGTYESPPLWAFCSPALENDGAVTVNCQVPLLPKLAIGYIFGTADQSLQKLDWSALTWELYLDGHPLDLEAFGIHNYVIPDLAPRPSPIREIFRQMKAWDVVITNPTPGLHILKGVARAEAETYTWTVNFTVDADLAR